MIAFLLAALQGAPGPSPVPYACTLATPRGDAVNFTMMSLPEGTGATIVFADQGSVWPLRTLPAARGVIRPEPKNRRWFALGGSDGLVIEVSAAAAAAAADKIPAALFGRKGRSLGVPLAFGFCAPRANPSIVFARLDRDADPVAVGQDIPAFDPRLWPQGDCGLLLDDGRRVRFGFTLDGNRAELKSPALWAGKPRTVPIKWLDGQGIQVGAFGHGRLSGVQLMYVDGSLAAKLIRFQDRDPGATVGGYAICGYTDLVRRPVAQ
ncbi:MAG: hypothetical protein ACJ8DZ_05980 [Allosphingosinicella sp.]